MDDQDQLLNPEEAAKILRLSASTLRNYRSLGTGPAFVKYGDHRGGRVFYRLKALHEFIARREIVPTQEAPDDRS